MSNEEKDLSPEEMSVHREEDVVSEELEDVESLNKALAEEKAKAENYLANWQRAQADFINYKRRIEQERNETVKFANATLALDLLPVLDDLERALDNITPKLAGLTWVDGIGLIYRKLQAILELHGLTEIQALGQPFDPNLHEAVLYGEGEEGKVVEELQKGYKLHDRVLRPTMVEVGKGKVEEGEIAEKEQ
ncbi:Protein GrpE [subsurface metagenome]